MISKIAKGVATLPGILEKSTETIGIFIKQHHFGINLINPFKQGFGNRFPHVMTAMGFGMLH